MPKPKKSVKQSVKSSKVLTKEEMQQYERECEEQVLCLSDSDYDVPAEDVDVNEKTFLKHLDNGFTNYDSDNDDEIVREYNDTESMDSAALSATSMGRDNKYDSDDDEKVSKINAQLKKTKSTKKNNTSKVNAK
ncbi:unnamed protein product [marine sediment metagenome]|uniref:Uncharacterized protein n=1 Tax=marine sediment metagenome TaxID=412755 RepID=X0UFK1_9ZZZZ